MNNIIFERFKNYWFIYPFILLWIIKPFLPEWGVVPPKSCLGGCGTIEGMIPFVQWVNNLIDILRNYEIFGLLVNSLAKPSPYGSVGTIGWYSS